MQSRPVCNNNNHVADGDHATWLRDNNRNQVEGMQKVLDQPFLNLEYQL